MLLTAKTAEESVLEGYEAGADFYLTKPFSIELLRNRLQHLAKMQEQRIQMLAKNESSAEPLSEEEMRISPIDRKFMTKMKSVMERFVADTTFSVDVFCSEMSMSRMNCYRKMHALTGLTPAQYINDYRLRLADRLLREGELNVSEVAERTGFTTASYFSKCYKTKFGVAPKEVRIK
jgi:AraC-like DNA-binding protein